MEIKLNDGVTTTGKKDVNVIVCPKKYIRAHAVNHFKQAGNSGAPCFITNRIEFL